jgi:hypothetical protein
MLRALVVAALLFALAPAPRAGAAATHLVLEPESALVFPGSEPIPLTGSLTIRLGAWPLDGPTTLEVLDLSIGASLVVATLDPEIAAAGLGIAFDDGTFLVPTLFLALEDDFVPTPPVPVAIPDLTGTLAEDGSSQLVLETAFELEINGSTASLVVVAAPEPGAAPLAGAAATVLAALAAHSSGRASGTRTQRSGSGWPSRSRKISRKR